MNITLLIMNSLFAVIFVTINGCTQLMYAQSLGYKLKPTGFAYFVGALGNIITGNVVPISGQVETLTLSGMVTNIRIRVGSLIFAASIGIILGFSNLISRFVDFAGEIVIFGMMAGVGLILSEVSLKLMKQEKRVGIISIVTAIILWAVTKDVVYTIAGSVLISTLDFCILSKRRVVFDDINSHAVVWQPWKKDYWRDFVLIKPQFNFMTIFMGLSIICLNIGSNISFGNITANLAGLQPHLDSLTVINSLADIPSVLFGGMPLEAIISGTAAAPFPVITGIIMMLLSGVLLMTGVLSKLGKFMPAQAISGFLLIIGFSLTLVPNLMLVTNSESPLEGIVAAAMTMLTKNAFIGMVAGIIVKFSKTLLGVL